MPAAKRGDMQNIESAKPCFFRCLSAACWNTTVMVRANTVSTWLQQPQATRWRFRWRCFADQRNQNGGDYAGECRIRRLRRAAFIQPRAINSSVPPSIIPVFNHRELNQSPYRQLTDDESEIIQHAAHSGNTGKKKYSNDLWVLISMICHLLSVVIPAC